VIPAFRKRNAPTDAVCVTPRLWGLFLCLKMHIGAIILSGNLINCIHRTLRGWRVGFFEYSNQEKSQ